MEKRRVTVSNQPEIDEVAQGFLGAHRVHRPALVQSAQGMRDLHVDQVWGVKHLTGRERHVGEALISAAPQQKLEAGGCIENDQRPLRMARIASADDSPSRTRERRSSRSFISAGLGRFARSSSSATK
jgi:hypothetical protein